MTDPRPVGAQSAEDDLLTFLRDAMAGAEQGLPLYQRLADALEFAVTSGILADGAPLPSERLLQEALQLSRVTVRGALDRLAEAGLVQRRQGARSLVRGRMEKTPALIGFSEEMRARGLTPSSKWIAREKSPATAIEAMALGLEPGALVARLTRLRLADGLPIAVEDAALPADLLPDPGRIGASLYDFLTLRGLAPHHGVQRIRAAMATPEEAAALGLTAGAPLLSIERRCFLADGRPLEFTRTRYSGATYEFVSQLTLPRRVPQ